MKPLAALRPLTVLCVDHEPMQRLLIGTLLEGFFRTVLLANGGGEALRLFQAQPVHLVVADLELPGPGGLDLIESIRRQDRDLPILVISASTATADLLVAVRLRLVDYLVKPITPGRLREALVRAATDLLAAGRLSVRLDPHTSYCLADGCLRGDRGTVPLTPRERVLLELLLNHRDQWLCSARLIGALNGDRGRGGEDSLKGLILRLRRKLGAAAIENRYGVGYRLTLPESDPGRNGTAPSGD